MSTNIYYDAVAVGIDVTVNFVGQLMLSFEGGKSGDESGADGVSDSESMEFVECELQSSSEGELEDVRSTSIHVFFAI